MTTTAFCTVLRVTSLGLRRRSTEASWRLHLSVTLSLIARERECVIRTICRIVSDSMGHSYLRRLQKAHTCSATLVISSACRPSVLCSVYEIRVVFFAL